MRLHQLVAPGGRALRIGTVVLAGSLSLTSRDARACGATPVEVKALLPLDHATNVPLNAVLISSSNLTEAVFELHQVLDDGSAGERAIADPADAGGDAASDAGLAGVVPLRVDCGARGRGAGAVCLARPLAVLKANTRYVWRTHLALAEGYIPEALSREFTTGGALDDEPISADAVGLVVTEEHHNPNSEAIACASSHWLEVAYSLDAAEPAVLHFENYTPYYVMHATLLMEGPGATASAVTLYAPPDCLAPVVYDVAGHRTALPEWCPGKGSASATEVDEVPRAAPPSPPASSASTEPAAPAGSASADRSRCGLSMPPTSTSRAAPTAAGLGLAWLLSRRRRRRL